MKGKAGDISESFVNGQSCTQVASFFNGEGFEQTAIVMRNDILKLPGYASPYIERDSVLHDTVERPAGKLQYQRCCKSTVKMISSHPKG